MCRHLASIKRLPSPASRACSVERTPRAAALSAFYRPRKDKGPLKSCCGAVRELPGRQRPLCIFPAVPNLCFPTLPRVSPVPCAFPAHKPCAFLLSCASPVHPRSSRLPDPHKGFGHNMGVTGRGGQTEVRDCPKPKQQHKHVPQSPTPLTCLLRSSESQNGRSTPACSPFHCYGGVQNLNDRRRGRRKGEGEGA